jgi:hypothetical protein
MSAAASPMPLSVVAMKPTLGRDRPVVLKESDPTLIAGFVDLWLGVVSWLQGVSDGREAVRR